MFGEEALWRDKRGVALRALGRLAKARDDLEIARQSQAKPWITGVRSSSSEIADLDQRRERAVTRYEAARTVCRAAGDRVCADEADRLRQTPFRNRSSVEIVSSM